jgi:hypothetical protein
MDPTQQSKLAEDAAVFLATHADWERMTREEISFLRSKNFKSAEAIMKIKSAVAERYQNQLRRLFEQKETLMALPVATKEALRNAQNIFDKVSAEYQQELSLALDASKRMIEMFKTAITRKATTSFFYGQSGSINQRNETRSLVFCATA